MCIELTYGYHVILARFPVARISPRKERFDNEKP